MKADPFSGCLFVFRNRRATAIKALVYDGQGYWLLHKRLSAGRFRFWRQRVTATAIPGTRCRSISALTISSILDGSTCPAAICDASSTATQIEGTFAKVLSGLITRYPLIFRDARLDRGSKYEFHYCGSLIASLPTEIQFERQLDLSGGVGAADLSEIYRRTAGRSAVKISLVE